MAKIDEKRRVNDDREVGFLTSSAARLVLAFAVTCLALAAGLNAFTNIWRSQRPELVLALFPNDPIAALNAEDYHGIAKMGASGGYRQAVIAAKQVLHDEPLTPAAFRLLGFAETSAGHTDEARALMVLAHRLSRRDAGTSIWLIHDSAGRGDVRGTLRYYDEVLRANPSVSDILFPPLTNALFDPAVRHALSIYVSNDPTWMPGFLGFAAEKSTSPADVARLVLETSGPALANNYDMFHARILDRLVEKSNIALAQYYLQHLLKITPNLTSDPAFLLSTTNPILGPFAWRLIDQPDVGSSLDDHEALQVRAATDAQGIVARRILTAGGGIYDFIQSVTYVYGTPAARLRWELRCIPAAAQEPFWVQSLPIGSISARYAFSVTIPENCPAQELTLSAGNDSSQGEAKATINSMALRRH